VVWRGTSPHRRPGPDTSGTPLCCLETPTPAGSKPRRFVHDTAALSSQQGPEPCRWSGPARRSARPPHRQEPNKFFGQKTPSPMTLGRNGGYWAPRKPSPRLPAHGAQKPARPAIAQMAPAASTEPKASEHHGPASLPPAHTSRQGGRCVRLLSPETRTAERQDQTISRSDRGEAERAKPTLAGNPVVSPGCHQQKRARESKGALTASILPRWVSGPVLVAAGSACASRRSRRCSQSKAG